MRPVRTCVRAAAAKPCGYDILRACGEKSSSKNKHAAGAVATRVKSSHAPKPKITPALRCNTAGCQSRASNHRQGCATTQR